MSTRGRRGLARPEAATAGALAGCLLALGVLGDAGNPGDRASDGPPTSVDRVDAEPQQTPRPGARDRRPTEERAGAVLGRPRLIVIRSVGVRAPVVPVAADDGVLVPPSRPTTVGWWSGGVRPGADRGAAVLTGHTVSTGGGAFDDLDQVTPGAVVDVTTARGSLSYVVLGSRTYGKQSLAEASGRVFDQSAPGRLVLVTCEDWNGEVYLSNHVVTARLVNRSSWA